MTPKNILIENDLKGQLEGPNEFDYKKLHTDINHVLGEIKAKIYPKAKIDGFIQEKSFQDEIVLYQIKRNDFSYQSCLRFSNFGRMVAYTSPDEEKKEIHVSILKILEKYNFKFIPNLVLDVEYNGINSKSGIKTWWIRYFDYI